MKLFNISGTITVAEGLALKAVSLLLALILWITILGFKKEEKRLSVKLEPILAPNMVIANKIPSTLEFNIVGSRIVLRDFEKKIQPIRPDLRKSPETTIGFSVNAELLGELPHGVKIISYFPPSVIITLEELTEKYVTVKPRIVGTVANGFEILTVKTEPSKVAIRGPKSLMRNVESISTEDVDVEGLNGQKEAIVAIEVDEERNFRTSREKVVKVIVMTKKIKR